MKPTLNSLDNLAAYNMAQGNHIEQLYSVALNYVPRMTRTEFICEVYVPHGMADRFRKYWDGQQHMVKPSEIESILCNDRLRYLDH